MLTEGFEADVHAAIAAEARRIGLDVYAINGTSDHVHLVVRKPPILSESKIMQRVKSVSSTIGRRVAERNDGQFRWQSQYGVFSFHRRQLNQVVAYVENQKQHHAERTLRES